MVLKQIFLISDKSKNGRLDEHTSCFLSEPSVKYNIDPMTKKKILPYKIHF